MYIFCSFLNLRLNYRSIVPRDPLIVKWMSGGFSDVENKKIQEKNGEKNYGILAIINNSKNNLPEIILKWKKASGKITKKISFYLSKSNVFSFF